MDSRIDTIRARLAELEQERLCLVRELASLSAGSMSHDIRGFLLLKNSLLPRRSVSPFLQGCSVVEMMFSLKCGKTRRRGQADIRRPARRNGCGVFAISRGSSVATVKTAILFPLMSRLFVAT